MLFKMYFRIRMLHNYITIYTHMVRMNVSNAVAVIYVHSTNLVSCGDAMHTSTIDILTFEWDTHLMLLMCLFLE